MHSWQFFTLLGAAYVAPLLPTAVGAGLGIFFAALGFFLVMSAK